MRGLDCLNNAKERAGGAIIAQQEPALHALKLTGRSCAQQTAMGQALHISRIGDCRAALLDRPHDYRR